MFAMSYVFEVVRLYKYTSVHALQTRRCVCRIALDYSINILSMRPLIIKLFPVIQLQFHSSYVAFSRKAHHHRVCNSKFLLAPWRGTTRRGLSAVPVRAGRLAQHHQRACFRRVAAPVLLTADRAESSVAHAENHAAD